MIRIKTKKLKVRSENVDIAYIPPAPSSTEIPDWYKKLPAVDPTEHDITIKKCTPVLDGFTAGYMFKTSADIFYDDKTTKFMDNGHEPQVSKHGQWQLDGMPSVDHLTPYPYKWTNKFYIQTPPGYSTLFVHPINRFDLPFQSLGAVVDTDDFPLSVQFPFFMKSGFSGIIPAGTPIIQAIPFKRDDWQMQFPNQTESYKYKDFWSWFDPPMAKYKRFFWKKKRYQ
jgi:hypothetical protein